MHFSRGFFCSLLSAYCHLITLTAQTERPRYLTTAGRGGHLPLLALVKLVDKTALVQFLDEAHIDKVLRFRGFRFWVRLPQRFENLFHSLQARILFWGKFLISNRVIVRSFQDLSVRYVEIFSQYPDPRFPVGLEAMDGFDLGFDIAPDNVGIFPDECAGSYPLLYPGREGAPP